jgi:hypothetical protein
MGFFVRKISKGKWRSDSNEPVIKADALTSCLRTSGNTLSFWRIDDLAQIEEAKLAIAASNSNLDTFDIVVFSTAEMEAFGAPIVETLGQTACTDLASRHRDLSELNSDHLIRLSYAVLDKVQKNDVDRVTTPKLKVMMANAAANDRLDLSLLSDSVKIKIGLPVPTKLACTCGAA